MFDPAILLSLEGHMPPQPPVMAEERMFQSNVGAAAERLGRKLADAFDSQADQWLARLDRTRAEAEILLTTGSIASEHLSQIKELIEEYEAHAELRTILSVRLAKRIRRDVKASFKFEPSVAAAKREMGQRLIKTEQRIVDALLDYALFLRAARAEGDPESRGGPVFDDPAALARHLDALAEA